MQDSNLRQYSVVWVSENNFLVLVWAIQDDEIFVLVAYELVAIIFSFPWPLYMTKMTCTVGFLHVFFHFLKLKLQPMIGKSSKHPASSHLRAET